ncbi:MAG: hypothetical protein QG594_984, partial [Bacteroidota bacterium]|nr:hypothetical protein [Bacteroidota bacterium]
LKANRNGESFVKIDNLFVTKNDGQGTTVNPKSKTLKLVISDTGSNQKYTIDDTEKPEISYEIVSNPDLFNGQKALVFSVIDSKSGVADVFVKEGNNDFVVAASPYLLENQSFGSIILIKAVDNAGNVAEVKVRSNITSHITVYFSSMLVKIIGGLIILIILMAVFYAKNKNKTN